MYTSSYMYIYITHTHTKEIFSYYKRMRQDVKTNLDCWHFLYERRNENTQCQQQTLAKINEIRNNELCVCIMYMKLKMDTPICFHALPVVEAHC